MRMNKIRLLVFIVLMAACAIAFTAACAEPMTFKNVSEALKYVRENQPMELTLENVKFKPTELLSIKNELPEGAVFHFTTTWGKISFTDETEEIDLNNVKDGVSGETLEAIVLICPNIRVIDNSSHRSPSNKVMIPLVEKYPNVQFEWQVHLGHGHYVKTTWSAFSTFLEPGSGRELKSEDLMLLKYCPRLKALDVGHNKLKNLDFLQYVPDLELLIIGQNYVSDITPIGQLKHLQYAELFTNSFTDLSPLAGLTHLMDLNIGYNKIRDFSPLYGMTSLRRLWLYNSVDRNGTEIPPEVMEALKKALPDCLIDDRSMPTLGGWREHPHFDVIHEMFRSPDGYQPFADSWPDNSEGDS